MSQIYLRLLKVSILWSEISPVLDWSTMLKIESTGLKANRYNTKWATCPCQAGDPRQEVRGPSLAPPPETALKRRKMSWMQLTSEMLAQTFLQRRLRDQLRGLLRCSPRPLYKEDSGGSGGILCLGTGQGRTDESCVVQNSATCGCHTLEIPLFHIRMCRMCRTHAQVLLCAKGYKMPFNLPYMLIRLGIFGFIKCTVAWFYFLCFLKWDS